MAKVEKPGKRTSVSPAASDSSGAAVSEMIRNKRQLTDEAPGNARGRRAGSSHSASQTEMPTPPAEERKIRRDGLQLELPANPMAILSYESTSTNVFKVAVDDVMDIIFEIEVGGYPFATGLEFVNRVFTQLQANQTCAENIKRVESALKTAWRLRMARLIGSTIHSAEELPAIVQAFAATVPIPAGRDSFEFRPARGFQLVASEIVHDYDSSKSTALSDKNNRVPIQEVEAALSSSMLLNVKTEPSSDTEQDVLRTKTRHTRTHPMEKPVTPEKDDASTKQLFSNPFDVFFHHVESYCSEVLGHSSERTQLGGAFRERIEASLNTLDEAHKVEWQQLRTDESSGLDAAKGRQLLVAQGTAAKIKLFIQASGFDRQNIHGSNPRISSELEIAPMFVPFEGKANKHTNAKQKVQFFADAPDTPSMDISEDRLPSACHAAFDRAPSFRGIEKWNADTWTATFASQAAADRWVGRSIQAEGGRFEIEAVFTSSPRMFISDFTDIDIHQSEVAYQVSRTFSGQAAGVKLYCQQSKKLYNGQQYVIRFPKGGGKWMRLYIPMRRESSGIWMASFKPLSKSGFCMLCGYKHNGQLCQSAKPVPLPRISQESVSFVRKVVQGTQQDHR